MRVGTPELLAAIGALFSAGNAYWDTDAAAVVQSDQATPFNEALEAVRPVKGGDGPFPLVEKRSAKGKGRGGTQRRKR